MSCIELKNASKNYKKDNTVIKAMDKITFKFESGKMYGIIGPSGSGKTTLLQCIGLIDKLTSGDLIIDNSIINKCNDDEVTDIRKYKIGFVFQMFYLMSNLSALENVMLPLFLNNKLSMKEKRKKAKKVLEMVGLEERLDHYPSELSGGECQRVAIARALVNNPKILLVDEATANLDEHNALLILNILKDLAKKGKCVIAVSHSNDIYKFADTVLIMKKGILNKNG